MRKRSSLKFSKKSVDFYLIIEFWESERSAGFIDNESMLSHPITTDDKGHWELILSKPLPTKILSTTKVTKVFTLKLILSLKLYAKEVHLSFLKNL